MHRRIGLVALPLLLLAGLARAGAPPSGLWSLRPIAFPRPPATTAGALVRNPIDAFVLARLEQKRLGFSPEADRRTLIRRVTFDLTGLPPTPEAIAAFVADKTPDAYEKVVDRLLASPAYGERWGRHWLDIARFGESHGYEYDHLRENAWRYRDWVVQALNADLPYDRFLTQQLAGDAQGDPTPTGFLVGGPMDEAGKNAAGLAVRLRAREEELEDMIGLVGQTVLGLTVHCARCHDHKFDPIPQRDYYRLKAALTGVQPGDLPALSPAQQREATARLVSLGQEERALRQQLVALEEPARRRLAPTGPEPRLQWRLPLAGRTAYREAPPSDLVLREKTLEAWVTLTDLTQHGGSALTVETEGGAQFDALVFGERERGKWTAGSEFFHRTKDLDAPPETQPDSLVQLVAVYRASGEIQLYRNGQPYGSAYTPAGEGLRTYAAGTWHLLFGQRHTGAGDFLKGTLHAARLYDRALTADDVVRAFQNCPLPVPDTALTPAERQERARLRAALTRLTVERTALTNPPLTYAARSQPPEPTFVLPRGDVLARGEPVTAGGLSAITACSPELGLTATAPEQERRRALAAWLTDYRNPLTARVIVNRVWQYHFGRGIVATPSDFGNNGEAPTHPALLDWLASAFLGPGEQRLKPLHRLILLSRTYRQASTPSARAAALDPENTLLWRFVPRRLEAEAIRDAMLAVSGRLNPAVGGPSFRPFTVRSFGSNFYERVDADTPDFNRRTLYRMGVQSARNPLLESLDCPDPSTKTPRRTVTTTPIQALALMNDPFVVRQSRALALRVQHEAGSAPAAQLARAYSLALGRLPTTSEKTRALPYLHAHSLESFCWALLNTSEFLYVR